jgi:phospholipid/cholesterol/gamma-HCH transport system substrate-binding protein
MGSKAIESIMGAVVLLVAAIFLVFALRHARPSVPTGYGVAAHFSSVGGLEVGSDVRINGIKVGAVTAERLDATSYQAVVDMVIDPKIQLPADTVASVASDGLLGGKHVRLEPGKAKTFVPPGGVVGNTRDYRSLEELVGEIIFLATGQSGTGSTQ